MNGRSAQKKKGALRDPFFNKPKIKPIRKILKKFAASYMTFVRLNSRRENCSKILIK
jgi:hypothetical protein